MKKLSPGHTQDASEPLATMSPRSRRRYKSKLSSARLRERQRKRVADMESEVERLEARIQFLRDTISTCKRYQAEFSAPSRSNSSSSSSGGAEQQPAREQKTSTREVLEQLAWATSELGDAQMSDIISTLQRRLEWLESSIRRVQAIRQAIVEKAAALGIPTPPPPPLPQQETLDRSRFSISFLTRSPDN